ncbi:MAG: immunity 52 family protein [Gemmataceae bacterium]|nr:immunity 52 family protein [Gemmataceae bacterium]MCI0737563.1 immunity 52 family protein [Gemmataceae bacterium]
MSETKFLSFPTPAARDREAASAVYDLFLRACWRARTETSQSCAARLFHFARALAASAPAFAFWHSKGESRADALGRLFDFYNQAAIADALEESASTHDGFAISLWNGESNTKSAAMRVHCGADGSPTQGCNEVILDFPEELDDLANADRMLALFAATVRCWDPDWAGVLSRAACGRADELFCDKKSRFGLLPQVDWILYLSKRLTPRLPKSLPCRVYGLDDLGALLVLSDCPPNPLDRAFRAKVKLVENALGIHF